MRKVLFLHDAKLLLKVTLRFGGRGLHALEMCLVQGYLMTALDALPLGFLRCTPIREWKKKKRTLRSHTDRSRVLKLGAEMNAYGCHFSKHILVKQHTEAFQQVAGNKFLYGIIMGFYINPMMDLYVDSGWRFFVF